MPSRPFDLAARALNLAALSAPVRRELGVAFQASDLRLDVYRPNATSTAPVVVLFFYGGGWVHGSREMYAFVGASLASRGLTTVIQDYRLGNAGRGYASLEDGAAALRWTQREFSEAKLILMGHSAGAFIAANLALNSQWSLRVAKPNADGFVGLAGPYQLANLDLAVRLPKAFLMEAKKDRIVTPGTALTLANRIRAAKGEVTIKSYANATHATLVGAFSPLLRWVGPVAHDIRQFAASL